MAIDTGHDEHAQHDNPLDTLLDFPPLTALALLASGVLIQSFQGDWGGRLLRGSLLGRLSIITGGGLAGWAFATFVGVGKGMPIPGKAPARLIKDGPYSFIRHPMYLAYILGTFGASRRIGLLWRNVIIINALYIAYLRKYALEEEAYLADHFGDEFTQYRNETPSGLPFVE